MGNLSLVTSIYKLDGTGIQMYDLNGILVTGSHKVKYKGKCIRVDKHPKSKKVSTQCKNLVCLNTTSHRITIQNTEFLDFSETNDVRLLDFKHQYIESLYSGRGSKAFCGQSTGVAADTLIELKNSVSTTISCIRVGDILKNGDVVKGICVHRIHETPYSVIDGVSMSSNTWVYKDNKIYKAGDIGDTVYSAEPFYVYQLITDSSMYSVNLYDNQIRVLDELETTEKFYHDMKDSIITSGRFRSKLIVV
jgi:hypothetical protein